MSDEEHRGHSEVELLGLKYEILKAENRWTMKHHRATTQLAEEYRSYLSRFIRDLPASEATAITEPDAPALPVRVPEPVASGSGQLMQVPALPGPSGLTAPGSDDTSNTPVHHEGGQHRGSESVGDREPEMEISRRTQTRANGDRRDLAPMIEYVNASLSYGIDVMLKRGFALISKQPAARARMPLKPVLVALALTPAATPRTSRLRPGLRCLPVRLCRHMHWQAIAFTVVKRGFHFFVKPVFITWHR